MWTEQHYGQKKVPRKVTHLKCACTELRTSPWYRKSQRVNVIHKWYADNGNACGRISDLYETFRALKTEGSGYGYFVNAPKCHMIVKKEKMDLALETFAGSNVQMTLGTRSLGSVIGTQETCDKFLDGKSEEQKKLLSKLGDIAKTNPQNAHSCLTKGVEHKVNFITRTTPSSSAPLETMEAIIGESIIPALTSRGEPLPIEREIFSLPLKSRGLGIDCPENRHDSYELSEKLSEPLEDKNLLTAELLQKRTLDDLLNAKKKKIAEKISILRSVLSTEERYALERASEKGASAWRNVLPLKRYGFQKENRNFETVSDLVMVGIQKTPHSTVHAERFSVWLMPCTALKAATQLFATRK